MMEPRDASVEAAWRRVIEVYTEGFSGTSLRIFSEAIAASTEAAVKGKEEEISDWKQLADARNQGLMLNQEKIADLTARLAAAIKDRNRTAEYAIYLDNAIDSLVAERDSLKAEREALQHTLDLWIAYHEWVVERCQGPITLAFAHGWRESADVVAEGKRRRAELGYQAPSDRAAAPPEGPPPPLTMGTYEGWKGSDG